MSNADGGADPSVEERVQARLNAQRRTSGKTGLVAVLLLAAVGAGGAMGWFLKPPCVKERTTEAETKPAHVELVEKAKEELPRIKELPELFEALIKDLEEGHAQLDRERAEHRDKLEAYEKMTKILAREAN